MTLQTMLVTSLILALLVGWLLWHFFNRKITAGQALFWLGGLASAEVLVVSPDLVAGLGALVFGDIWPVSWITLCAMAVVIAYLLYLTMRLNAVARVGELARSISYLERRVRELESELAARPAASPAESVHG